MAKQTETIDIDEVVTGAATKAKPAKTAKSKQSSKASSAQDSPFGGGFPGMGGMGGMNGMSNEDLMKQFQQMGGMDTLQKMMAQSGMKLPLKQRIAMKVMFFFTKHKKKLSNKLLWPIWFVLGLVLAAVVLVLGLVFLAYKLVRSVLSCYADMFRRSK